MPSRRRFLENSILATGAVITGSCQTNVAAAQSGTTVKKPIVISTWDFGKAANAVAWEH